MTVELDVNSVARIAEHEPHGWVISMPLQAVWAQKPVPGYMMNCACGWHGWIMADPDNPPRESLGAFSI